MNFRDLEYVVAVADLRSFSDAAEQCCVSQPTLSAQIKKLETILGAKLFERTNKRVMPTEFGVQVAQSARRVLNEVETIRSIASAAKDPMAGRYRIGAFPTLASYLFPDLVPYVKAVAPRLRMILVEEKSENLLEMLLHGQLDAAFLAAPVMDDHVYAEHLFNDPFYLAASDENSLSKRKKVNLGALSDQEVLLLEEGHCLRDQALDICNLMGVSEDVDFRATSLETLRQMVRADSGVTLVPEVAIRESDDGIKYIPFNDKTLYRSIALVRRKTCARTGVFEMICDAVMKTRSA